MNSFRDQLLHTVPNQRRFFAGVGMSDAMSQTAQRYNLQPHETVEAVVTALTSLILAITPAEELGTAASVVCEAIHKRLTVTGDTGEHHPRRMV